MKTVLLLLAACSTTDPHAGHAAPPPNAVIDVAPEVAAALEIRTERATFSEARVPRRGPATVAWDPHAVTRVTAQAGGQIRSLLLPRPGETVLAGQVVARLYQPEVRAAFEELEVAARLGEPWLSAARSRLVATGVSPAEVARALGAGGVPETYAVRTPSSGVVLEHPVREGAWIGAGGVIGVIGDPDALVVEVVVGARAPAPDTAMTLRDPGSGAWWAARVSGPLPEADAAGLRVRVVPEGAVPVGRPLIAEWTDAGPGGIWVPRTALVDTGARRVVFVEIAPGRFEPRAVAVGPSAGDRVQVLDGVVEGEAVVVAGTFLLDSETQIGAGGHAGHGAVP